MPDEVEKSFVKSFVGFLKQQIENQSLSSDGLESVEVAVQCLEAAFEVNSEDANASSSAAAPAPLDLFEIYQSIYAEQNPESKDVGEQLKNEGNRLMKEEKYYEAILQYNRAITFDPKNPVFYCNRAAAHIRLGDHNKAVSDCKLALVYNPDYAKAYGRMGIAYSNLCKFEEAKTAYLKAIELEPGNEYYMNNLRVAEERISQAPAAGGIPGMDFLNNDNTRNLFQDMIQDPVVGPALQALGRNPERFIDMSRQIASQLTQSPNYLENIRNQMMAGQQPNSTGEFNIQQFQDQLPNLLSNLIGNNAANNTAPPNNGPSENNQEPPPSS